MDEELKETTVDERIDCIKKQFNRNNNIGIDLDALIAVEDNIVDILWQCPICYKNYIATCYQRLKRKFPFCEKCNSIVNSARTGENDLLSNRPKIADTWHPTKNNGLKPWMVSVASNHVVWWHCKQCGWDWQVDVYDRCCSSDDAGCPVCSHRYLRRGFNDLMTTSPSIASQWCQKRNGKVHAYDVMDGTKNIIVNGLKQKPYWKCKQCGYEWQATCLERTRQGCNCPACNHSAVHTGFNDLKTKYPDVIQDWDYDKNTISPDEILPGSVIKVWWKCKKCGKSWMSAPNTHVKGHGCPRCSKRCLHEENGFADSLSDLLPQYANEIHSYRSITFNKAAKTIGINHVFPSEIRQKQLDILIPSLKIAIEFNGIYWHSHDILKKHNMTPHDYHKMKFNYCNDIGIKLLFVWEDDWIDRKDEILNAVYEVVNNGTTNIPPILHRLEL